MVLETTYRHFVLAPTRLWGWGGVGDECQLIAYVYAGIVTLTDSHVMVYNNDEQRLYYVHVELIIY